MEYAVICLAALLASGLTLFSGFGLGTLLMPVFALFFPLPVAVAATAAVHLANNFFKLALVGRHADFRIVRRFGLPGAVTAVVGALLLKAISGGGVLFTYVLFDQPCEVTLVKLAMAVLILGFAVLELLPRFERLSFDARYLSLGGALSGFFGGLSGHQGALRSAFLLNAGLSKEAYVATGAVCAAIVDGVRLLVYGVTFLPVMFAAVSTGGLGAPELVLAGTVAAFAGSFVGARLVKKVKIRTIQVLTGIMLLLLGLALGVGVV